MDRRKFVSYKIANDFRTRFIKPIIDRDINMHILIGNHDTYYKNTNDINSIEELLGGKEYGRSWAKNIEYYPEACVVEFDGTPIFFCPWINSENYGSVMRKIAMADANICMGHLEINGFEMHKGHFSESGYPKEMFKKFDTVFSGHFHKKSSAGNITYLGNTYQLYWNDEGETRGFHIFDMKTNKLEFIENTNKMFHKLYYNEKEKRLINHHKFGGTYVKIIVEEKSTPARLSQLVDNLYSAGVHDVKIIENLDLGIDVEEEVESEDTLTTLTNYVNAMEVDLNKENIINIFKSLYVESQEV